MRAFASKRHTREGAAFDDTAGTRIALNKTARFVPQNPNPSAGTEGFHWNAIANMSWGVLAEMFLRATAEARAGNPDNLKAFFQKRLAVPWNDEEHDFAADVFTDTSDYTLGQTDWEREGVADAATRSFVPACEWHGDPDAPRLRFLTVDVQGGYFYYVVRAWSPLGDSRLILCGMANSFAELSEIREKWSIPRRFVFLDGSFDTQRVAEWCSQTGAIVLMGDRVAGRAFFRHGDKRERVYAPKRLIKCAGGKIAESYYFSNLSCKDKLAELRSGESSATWELPSDVPVNYLRQISGSEYRTLTANNKPIWLQRGRRPNHYFDCETMQVCAAHMANIFADRECVIKERQ